jgi:hypothetical protein
MARRKKIGSGPNRSAAVTLAQRQRREREMTQETGHLCEFTQSGTFALPLMQASRWPIICKGETDPYEQETAMRALNSDMISIKDLIGDLQEPADTLPGDDMIEANYARKRRGWTWKRSGQPRCEVLNDAAYC